MKKNQNKITKIVLMWFPTVLWAAVIFTLSSIEQVKVNDFFVWDFLIKKTAHVTEYAILCALILKATNFKWKLAVVLTASYAATDEFHQSFVPGRTATAIDFGFDAVGAIISAYIIWKYKQDRKNKQEI